MSIRTSLGWLARPAGPAARAIRTAAALLGLAIASSGAQQPIPGAPPQKSTAAQSEPKSWTAAEDHQQMMQQLGIRVLRPGPSGNESAPNHANYDEATANPFPDLPPVLTLKNGRKVTTARAWAQRRAELIEDFEREVYGRIAKHVTKE